MFAGVGAEAGGAMVLTRLLSTYLYAVSATDPTTFSLAAGTLTGISLIAILGPALEAANVHAAKSPRCE